MDVGGHCSNVGMEAATADIRAALDAVDAAWPSRGTDRQADAAAMTDAALLAVNEAVAGARRRLDALHTRVAAEIARRSRPELGKEGLARKTGHRTPAKLIAAATGGHPGDAARLIQVGEATQHRTLFGGGRAPARHPHVAAGLAAGAISVDAAAAITAMLARVSMRVDPGRLDAAEETIVAQAALLSLSELGAVLRRAEAYLDPDGLEPAIGDLRGERSLRISEDRDGMTVFTARLDPETAAPIKAAIEAIVTHQLRTSRGRNHPDRAEHHGGDEAHAGGAAAAGRDSDGGGEDWCGRDGGEVRDPAGPVAEETRTIPQLQADALAAICRHALGCDRTELPLASTTVVVRIPLEALADGTGVATIDGMTQPIDVGTARRMAAQGQVIPCVLGGDSEVLDFGRAKRFFTPAQRLALVERDGGCAFCGLPPDMTEGHHLRWWDRDAGPTDLRNGILLCTACHHRIHDDGWEIQIDPPPGGDPTGGTVWFIPPAYLDPSRTPRLGGRRRFDPALWRLAA